MAPLLRLLVVPASAVTGCAIAPGVNGRGVGTGMRTPANPAGTRPVSET